MKKLLTLIMPDIAVEEVENAPEEIEILSYGGDTKLSDAVKRAKGKYTVISAGDAEAAVEEDFFPTLQSASADILKFDGLFAFKTPLVKSIPAKNCSDKYTAEVCSVLNAKSVEAVAGAPFTFKANENFDFENGKEIFTAAVEEFNRSKPKLSKEVYSVAVEVICTKLARFYARALLAIRAKALSAEEFAEFDGYLKENVVLYLALCKRLPAADLNKIRQNGYKIGYFAYIKLKKTV